METMRDTLGITEVSRMGEAALGRLNGTSSKGVMRSSATGRFVVVAKPGAAVSRRARQAVETITEGREQRELGDRKIRRGIFALHDAGWSQREIAKLAGVSQPEVSRRLKRRALESRNAEPREVILQRAAGQISSAEMLERLGAMPLTVKVPGRRSAYDGAATATGTAKQLVNALHQGLLTEAEYEQLRTARRRG